MSSAAVRLAAELAADDPLLAACVARDPEFSSGPAQVVEIGPRTSHRAGDYRYALEVIREGHLLHGGGGRVLLTGDSDLALLAGDRLYAEGLLRIAEIGDAEAIVELSQLIVACAVARVSDDPDFAEVAWAQTCERIAGKA